MNYIAQELRDESVDAINPALHRRAAEEIERLGRELAEKEAALVVCTNALAEIREVWAGSEAGEPVHAQEAYAIRLCKQQYQMAVDAIANLPESVKQDAEIFRLVKEIERVESLAETGSKEHDPEEAIDLLDALCKAVRAREGK